MTLPESADQAAFRNKKIKKINRIKLQKIADWADKFMTDTLGKCF